MSSHFTIFFSNSYPIAEKSVSSTNPKVLTSFCCFVFKYFQKSWNDIPKLHFFGEFLDHCILLCKGELQSDCEVIYFNPSLTLDGHSNFVSCSATYNFFFNPSLLKVFEYKRAKTCKYVVLLGFVELTDFPAIGFEFEKNNCKMRTHYCKKSKQTLKSERE